jgi:hypothetical protein
LPQRFAQVHPRYQTPWFGTLVIGVVGFTIYLVMTLGSQNSLADMVASLGLATAFYYSITAYACVWTYRRTLLSSARDFWLRGALPLVGAVAMTWAFVQSAIDMYAPDYGKTHFGPIGGVFVSSVRVLLKMGNRRLGQPVGGHARGLKLAQQRGQLNPHRVLHHGRWVQVGAGEHGAQPLDVTIQVTAATGLDQQPAQPSGSQPGSPGRCRCGRQRVDRIDHPAGLAQRGHPQPMVGFDPHRDRMLSAVADLGQQRQQMCEPGRVVADPPARHHTPVVIDHRHIVMVTGPVDSAIQTQSVSTPSIGDSVVASGVVRRRRTRRSVISPTVTDSTTRHDLVLSKSSRLGSNHQEVNPAAGSDNGIPPPHRVICRQARRASLSCRTTGEIRHHLDDRPRQKQTPVTMDRQPVPTNRLGET